MTVAARRILVVVGTRPEAIKMAPVILALRAQPWVDLRVLATAQHRQMLDQVLGAFGIVPDLDLDVMQSNQQLADLTARLLEGLDAVLKTERPEAVLAQGDTTTVFATALACFYRGISFGHVEAGLRTGDVGNPFPEEFNRVVVGRMARWHFAPTTNASKNLLDEGLTPEAIHVTGNTVIDALHHISRNSVATQSASLPEGRMILVTAHRRENFGQPLRNIFNALREIVDERPDVCVVYPVHPNPNVSVLAHEILGCHPRIRLCEPMEYVSFVAAMKSACLILTDSGGIQEEAPALGKPVLVLRNETERPEAIEAGVAKLVGTDTRTIVDETLRLLDSDATYQQMAQGISPYGDGSAAMRIAEILARDLIGVDPSSD